MLDEDCVWQVGYPVLPTQVHFDVRSSSHKQRKHSLNKLSSPLETLRRGSKSKSKGAEPEFYSAKWRPSSRAQ